MRKIKFRAWDKTRNYMSWGNSNLMINFGGLKMWQFANDPPTPVDQGDYILMQYTGLKDKKNEQEIYEGDIVRVVIEELFNDFEEVGVIEFKNGSTYIDFPNRGVGIWAGSDSVNIIEVIGNEYGNPELLEETPPAKEA